MHEFAEGVALEALMAASADGITCETLTQASLVRDVFGNPFRPVTIDPAWRTPEVVRVAEAIYEDRAFDRMPILGDAPQPPKIQRVSAKAEPLQPPTESTEAPKSEAQKPAPTEGNAQ